LVSFKLSMCMAQYPTGSVPEMILFHSQDIAPIRNVTMDEALTRR
jgi:hypothetical protein